MSTDPDQINEEYRRTVTERDARRALRREIEGAIGLFVLRFTAIVSFIGSVLMILLSIQQLVTVVRSQTPVASPVAFTIGFMGIQVTAWVYILLFPLYMRSLHKKKQ